MVESAEQKLCDGEQELPRKGRPIVMDARQRRQIIFDALDALFREVGLKGMTMSAIARRAGMAKQTLYGLFRDRDTLFEAYLEHRLADYDAVMDQPADGAGFEARLRLMFRFDDPDDAWDLPIAMFRLAVIEVDQHPRLCRRCLEEGPRNKQNRIKEELDRACATGELKVADTAAAAALLMDMLHLPILEALADPHYRPTREAWKRRFEYGLGVFLRGVT
ncbi:TetR/AcrR family transcriptional regulator [Chachezhania sediminis]|uniref:TetR/AcrR family transcriptional regulator n=1 Tax=Chachezhania sediminis TaxID=2599291 RepID=UPI001E449136|nr:TetR/AcrR family transcriptional regulator [Chachezhania sediminis]